MEVLAFDFDATPEPKPAAASADQIEAALDALDSESRRFLLICLSATQLSRYGESLADLLAALHDPPVPAAGRNCLPLQRPAGVRTQPKAPSSAAAASDPTGRRFLTALAPLSEWLTASLNMTPTFPGGDVFRRAATRFMRSAPEAVDLGWALIERGRMRWVQERVYGFSHHTPSSGTPCRAGAMLLLLAGCDPDLLKLDRPGGIEGLTLSSLLPGLLQLLPENLDGEDLLALPRPLQATLLYRQLITLQIWPQPRMHALIKVGHGLLGLPVQQGGLDGPQALTLRELELDHWLAHGVGPMPPRIGKTPATLEAAYRDSQILLTNSGPPSTLAAQVQVIAREYAKLVSTRDPLLPSVCGLLQLLALAAEGGVKNLGLLHKLSRGAGGMSNWVQMTETLVEAEIAGQPARLTINPSAPSLQTLYLIAVLQHWAGTPLSKDGRQAMEAALRVTEALEWRWIGNGLRQALGLAIVGAPGPESWRRVRAPWERALTALSRYAGVQTETVDNSSYARLRVELSGVNRSGSPAARAPLRMEHIALTVRERSPAAHGGHTAGRVLSPAKAAETAKRLAPGDAAGREFLRVWQDQSYSEYGPTSANAPLVTAMADLDDLEIQTAPGKSLPVRLVIQRPALTLDPGADGQVVMRLQPPPAAQGSYLDLDVNSASLTLVQYDAETLALAKALGKSTELPATAVPKLAALAPSLARKLPLQNRAGVTARRVGPVDTRIHVQIEPLPTGLSYSLRVRPLGANGLFCPPGQGNPELHGLLDDETVLVQRDLAAEQRALEAVYIELPLLSGGGVLEPVSLSDPEQALSLLEQLQGMGSGEESRLPLHWPARPVRISPVRSTKSLSLKLGSQRDWLSAEGELTLDDGEVVDLVQLLDALPSSHGRFVQLGESRVLALSQQLAKQLRQLKLMREGNTGVKLPWLAAAALEPLLTEAGTVESTAGFRQRLASIREAMALDPALPTAFAANLRDYQREGVRWLLRLAHWAPGACLADDMGLGKTVQTLAVLVARASLGPQLVLAPTSVVGNWQREAARFAPTLTVRVYAEGDRTANLASLAPGSLLLLSYGLLAQDIDSIQPQRFATVVYDEAQAIKNPQTQRAQAARQLQADFSIATTGTPIENHLGELWSLFRIIAPGLLGSQEQFSRRFATPIASDASSSARTTLRQLIAPFILRRNKHEVLEELPSRTEMVIRIDPDAAEARLQLALRQQALERLQADALDDNHRRFNILAALTRLRRAACHPALVAPELGLPGSKLTQLLELIEELREGRHRALVFSQFTDFLALVRRALDTRGISFQYLDGQTTPKARQQAIDAFQSGRGDLFLLSLKAGGVGLNLTAADYVIHLDPWWNPAIEQQATDRAHRIGQTRPVTVYKLVLAGSIEEQILSLHGSKRELVDAMLAEQDGGSRMGLDDLLGLLRGIEG